MRRDCKQRKGYQIVELWVCEWSSLSKTDASVKSYMRENFPYRRPLSEEGLMQGINDGRLLVMFNVILKCLNTCGTTFTASLPYSKLLP